MRGWWLLFALVACSHAGAPLESGGSERASPTARSQGSEPRRVVTDTKIELLDPITFLPASSALDPRSVPILDAIAQTLNGNPTIELVEVQAYALDALPQFRARIAAERAQIIVDQLVSRGVARGRLTPAGIDPAPPGITGVPALMILRRS